MPSNAISNTSTISSQTPTEMPAAVPRSRTRLEIRYPIATNTAPGRGPTEMTDGYSIRGSHANKVALNPGGTVMGGNRFSVAEPIFHATEPRVQAVLDWELSTTGDPMADFTYLLMQWTMPVTEAGAGTATLVGRDLDALGIPSLASYVDAYVARTGLDPR